VRGVQVPQDNLEQNGHGLSAPGGQQANAEEMLAELVRLVKSSGLAPTRRPPPVEPPPVEIVPEQSLPDRAPAQPLEMNSPALPIEAPSRQLKETALVDVEPIRATRSDDSPSSDPNAIGLAAGRRSGPWTFRVSALALAAAAAVGAIFWLEQMKSEPPKAPPLLSAAQSPTMAAPRANPSVATSGEAGATPPRDLTQPAEGKTVSPEQWPIDPNARASLENPPPSQDLGPTAGGVARPEALPAEKPPAAPVDTPAVAAPIAAPPPAESQSPEKAAPAVSLPSEPAQVATPTPASAEMGAAPPSDAPLPPVRPAPKATVQASGAAQRPTPKLESPTKLSGPSGAHAAAKAGATGLAAPQSPLRLGASANPENKAAQASVEPPAAPQAQPEPAPKQPSANPVARAFGTVAGAVGAVAGLIPFVPH
jgi:hypothetical protein